ncbi:urea ABC transporter permease subunit UrtB [Arthrobacter sp. AB6]|uniref:urea ABC transporter permease subunit UrtB n=1 Tax=Arthrobacter sp. AB6 TaxID=2962570 RepID=UPI002882C903|nr:urea ABC transporter permease subunit UrtB [Arthrobacter sp. AB6]MDT0196694.1 urea ABC transporter permease subunit UrtB [Arthrobacter sp. AB6]
MDPLLSQAVAGVSLGSILLLAALGLSLTFGQMGVINMAHGEFIMAGCYTTFVVQQLIGNPTIALVVSLAAGFAVAGLLGGLLEISLIRRMYHRPLDTLLVTFGVGLVLQQAARDIFGAPAVNVLTPLWLQGSVEAFGMEIPSSRLFILALAVLAVLTLGAVLQYTPLGRRVRAVVQNRDLAESSGIPTRRIDLASFVIGSGLAGIAGVALTLVGATSPTIGQSYIVDAFLVVVAGGLGNLRGAIIAAFAVGLMNAYVEFWTTASLSKVIVFLAIIAFLQIRPQGLFALKTRSLL